MNEIENLQSEKNKLSKEHATARSNLDGIIREESRLNRSITVKKKENFIQIIKLRKMKETLCELERLKLQYCDANRQNHTEDNKILIMKI